MRKQREKHYLGYFIHEGLSNMFTHGFMSFAAIGITIACLLIMGTFSLVAVNADATLTVLEQENEILAFVDETLSESQARALERKLLAIDNVSGVRFITREEAREAYISQFEGDALFEGTDPSTFRHRYSISLHELSQQKDTVGKIVLVDGIAKVNAYEALSNGFITIRNIATIISVALIAVLFLVSVFIIANTIKLTFFDRREEIAIMKMVGATDSFVRWPFVYEGFLMGLVSALIAFVLQWLLYGFITSGIDTSDIFAIIQIVPFAEIWHIVALVFVGAGVLIGVGGSLSAIRQFLKV